MPRLRLCEEFNKECLQSGIYFKVLDFFKIKKVDYAKDDLFNFIEYVYTKHVNKFSLEKPYSEHGFGFYFRHENTQKEIKNAHKENTLKKLSDSCAFMKDFLNTKINFEYEGAFPIRPTEQAVCLISWIALTIEDKTSGSCADMLCDVMYNLKNISKYGHIRKTSSVTRGYSNCAYRNIEEKFLLASTDILARHNSNIIRYQDNYKNISDFLLQAKGDYKNESTRHHTVNV